MSGYKELIDLIQDGELVAAAIANRAPQQLDQNVRYLRDVIEAALMGETVFARSKVVEVDAKVGMAVYYDYVSQTFKRAMGGVETDSSTGLLSATAASQVWGVVYQKFTSTSADILLFGTADIDLSEAVDVAVTEGTLYYLSNAAPGKLIATSQPVGVTVLQTAEENADGTHTIFLNTTFQDFLTAHRHYKFSLQPVPAGTNNIPGVGELHTITSADPLVEGWLPADHAIFSGNAPAGAKFGYNLSVSSLNNLWPPIPAENAILDMVKSGDAGYTTVPGELVVIDRNGIWWLSNCYDEVPWPLDYGQVDSTSESVSVTCPTALDMQLTLWFTKPTFQNTSTAVLSLSAITDSGLSLVCADTGNPASTGHLLIGLDLDVTVSGDDLEAGYLAYKRIDGNKFYRGPIVESLTAGSANVTLAGDLASGGKNYGNIIVTVDNEVDGKDLIVDTIRLDGVTEEFYEDTIALGFSAGQASEFRGRVHIPDSVNIPAGTLMKFRFRVMSRSAATLPKETFSLSYRRVPEPSALLTPVALPTVDTNLTDQPASAIAFAAADMYFEFETESFAIASGDTVLFTLSRASDAYGGDLFLLRQRGVLVAGS